MACGQLLISGKCVSQFTLYSLIFNPLHSVINGEQYKKAFLQSFQPLWKIQNVRSTKRVPQLLIKNWVCYWTSCATRLLFQLLWTAFQSKDSVRNAPASTTLIQVLHWNHDMCTTHCYLWIRIFFLISFVEGFMVDLKIFL